MDDKEKALAGANRHQGLTRLLDRYGLARQRALSMAQYIRSEPGKRPARRAERLEGCGAWLKFRDYYTVQEVRLVAAQFCRQHLLCPLCAIRRGAKALAGYLVKIEHLRALRPSLRVWFYSLTIRNRPGLADAIGHLQECRRLLHQKRRNALRGKSRCELASLAGGVESVEVKRGAGSGLWHPHIHGLGLGERAPDESALAAEWLEISGDSYEVDVRPVGDTVKDLCEVFKYALKFSSLSLADNWDAFRTLQGKRLMFPWGCLFGVQVPEELTDELLPEELPYVELFFRYVQGAYEARRGVVPAT